MLADRGVCVCVVRAVLVGFDGVGVLLVVVGLAGCD